MINLCVPVQEYTLQFTRMKSNSGVCTILGVLLTLCLVTGTVNADDDDEVYTCSSGWELLNGYCYYFSDKDEVLGFYDADTACRDAIGEMVWPQSEDELQALQTYAASTDTYGWWLNVLYNEYLDGFPAWNNELDGTNVQIPDDQLSALPTLYSDHEMSTDPNKNCLAFHVDANVYETEPWYQSVQCLLYLSVACQTQQIGVGIDNNKYFASGDYVFYLPGKLATFEDGKDTCTNEGMGLVDQPYAMLTALDHSPVIDGTPFWSAATLGSNGPEWENGTAVDPSQFIWDSDVDEHSSYYFGYVLTNSGRGQLYRTYESQWPEAYTLPYICKKLPMLAYEYDCPNEWIRAGRSCYFFPQYTYLTWYDAKDKCEETEGAHLIKIDSIDERLWLTAAIGPRQVSNVWTGANDLDSEGNFTWHDGSPMDTDIFPWSDGGSYGLSLEYRCVVVNLDIQGLAATDCDRESASAGCQYTLTDSGQSQCADNWVEYNGMCYFLDASGTLIKKDINELVCLANTEGVDSYLVIDLQVQSQDLIDFLAGQYLGGVGYYWTGAEASEVVGEYVWADGTVDDLSLFLTQEEPDNEDRGDPENCVWANELYNAFDTKCDLTTEFLCELELPPLQSSTSRLQVHGTAVVLLATVVLIIGFSTTF